MNSAHDTRHHAAAELVRRVVGPRTLILDGATGTEIERRGIEAGLPLWSTRALLEAPSVVAAIHRDYIAAGAEIITANTFRTQARVLARAEETRGRARDLTCDAVALARNAVEDSRKKVFVAGSAPPLEDCYRPDRVPGPRLLRAEHREHALILAEAGVDLILVETMNRIDEARAASSAAAETGLPFLVSLVCGRDGHLLSGEPLAMAIEVIGPLGPIALGINCLAPSAVPACLPALAESDLPFGVYANLGAPEEGQPAGRSEACSPEEFARLGRSWVNAGACFVGGCCGTTPDHIRALAGELLIPRP